MERVSDAAVFCIVVEEGSFSAAAEALALSKGAVSKYVSRIEARLGVRLLSRTTRTLSVTEAGSVFYQRASRAFAELDEAEREVSDHADRPRGHLRVSAPTFYGAEILSRELATFHHHYPDISMDLVLDNRLVDIVGERFDVAVRISAPKDSSLVMRKLAELPIVVCASPAYLAQRGRPEVPEDLSRHNCLIYSSARRAQEWDFFANNGSASAVHVDGNYRMNDDHALRRAALDGLGILYMPKLFLQEALDCGELVQLWPDNLTPGVALAVVYPSRHQLPAKVRAFTDFMAGNV